MRYLVLSLVVLSLLVVPGCGKKKATPEEIKTSMDKLTACLASGDFDGAKAEIKTLEGFKLDDKQEEALKVLKKQCEDLEKAAEDVEEAAEEAAEEASETIENLTD